MGSIFEHFLFYVYKRVREIEVLEIMFLCLRRRREQQKKKKKNVAHEEVSEMFVSREWLQGPIPLSVLFLPQLFILPLLLSSFLPQLFF